MAPGRAGAAGGPVQPYLVNLSEIREYTRSSVTLDGGPTLPVGDIYRPALTPVFSGK